MRFEAYHRVLKQIALSSSNKINIIKTIIIRSQLFLAYLRCNKMISYDEVEFEGTDMIETRLKKMYFPNVGPEIVYSVHEAKFNEKLYKKNMILVVEMDENYLVFGQVQNIFVHNNEISFLFKLYHSLGFDENMYAYRVEFVDKLNTLHFANCY